MAEALEQTVRAFLRDELQVQGELRPDDPIFSSGMLDSFAFAVLVGFLQAHLSVTVPPDDISLDNFDTVSAILTYASRRTAG